ncbi:MAG: SUMF1/EgtB/PvdO family nonheme iron enzyme, partial [Nitrospinae bacterium]|nr:SUMF1/EgtB/PvdO family nonheme iron enzyme [Nitrospinota bacterium]
GSCRYRPRGDMTPPVTTVALAEVSKTSMTWSGSATINEAGIGYCTALITGSPAPTAAEVRADNDGNVAGTGGSVAMTANTTATCVVTGLTTGTTYDFYFVAEDFSANLQTTANVSGPVTATTLGSATLTTQMVHGVSTDTIAWLVAKTDTNSTGYCVAVPQGSAAPAVAQIAAGVGGAIVGTQGTVALTANTSGFCTVTGLTASTAYDLYFVAKDGANVFQAAASSALNKSTTAAQGAAPAGMVAVLGGCFMMGDNFAEGNADELPVHPVCISSYFMDAKEVTQAAHTAWGADTTFTAYAFPAGADCGGLATTCPAESVDWTNASAYCVAQGKRLPTEAEWEYAARNRGALVHYGTSGDGITCAEANGWLAGACVGAGATSAVGSYAPNGLVLYDMSGNVWEWVSDYYDANYYSSSPVTNPENAVVAANRVVRGGSWGEFSANLRASGRHNYGPVNWFPFIGFRCSSN